MPAGQTAKDLTESNPFSCVGRQQKHKYRQWTDQNARQDEIKSIEKSPAPNVDRIRDVDERMIAAVVRERRSFPSHCYSKKVRWSM